MKPEVTAVKDDTGLRLINNFTMTVVLLAGLGVSIVMLLHDQRNFQETYNLHLAARRGLPLSSLGSTDDPMPLYFLLERGWLHLTTNFTSLSSLIAVRLLSIIFYPLSALAAYSVGIRATKSSRVGCLAAMFLCLSPFMLWYSSRATMYSVLVFAVLLNQYFYTKVLEKPRWWDWVGYCLSGLIALGVHYFFLVILLVQIVFYVSKVRHIKKLDNLWMLLSIIGIGLVFAWWIHFSNESTHLWQYLPYTSRPSATNTFIVFVQYLFGFQSVVITTAIIALWPLLVIVALLAIQKYVAPPIGIQYSLWAAITPVLGIFILSWLWKPLFLSSYLIVGLAPLMLLLGWYFVALNLRTLNLACYVLLAAMVVTFVIEANNPSRAIQNDYLGSVVSTRAERIQSLVR